MHKVLFDDVLLQISVLLHTHIQNECYYYGSMGHRFSAILSRGVHVGGAVQEAGTCTGSEHIGKE